MKSFNLADAIAGKPLITRDGIPAKFLMYLPEYRTVVAFENGLTHAYDEKTGKYKPLEDSPCDLFMAQELKPFDINRARTTPMPYITRNGRKAEFIGWSNVLHVAIFVIDNRTESRHKNGRVFNNPNDDTDGDIFEVQ